MSHRVDLSGRCRGCGEPLNYGPNDKVESVFTNDQDGEVIEVFWHRECWERHNFAKGEGLSQEESVNNTGYSNSTEAVNPRATSSGRKGIETRRSRLSADRSTARPATVHATTPIAVSPAMWDLCRDLVSDPAPVFLPVAPLPSAEVNDCFAIVEKHVHDNGGSICCGWQIWELPTVYIEAEFHAVWKDTNGTLQDITPKQLQGQRVLFLPDPVRSYDGRQVNNVRRALSRHPDVTSFIAAADAEFELMNRGSRAYEHGQIRLRNDEAFELIAIRERKEAAYAAIVARLLRPGRNDPCFCGSGKKFKKCHGS